MSNSYLVLCSRNKEACLIQAGYVGRPLDVWFGGLHTSAPRFSTFGVQPGDTVYPVAVRRGLMHLVTRLEVAELMTVRRYLATRFGVPEGDAVRCWEQVDRLAAERPELRPVLPLGCLDEAAVGAGTAVRFDRAVPGEALERLRLQSRTGPERGLRYLEDGRLKKVQTLLGRIYRLSEPSAEEFAELFAQLDSPAAPNQRFAPVWRSPSAEGLARVICNEHRFDLLPILADALEEAGCDNHAILAHCREQRKHIRGCWVVDLVLGRK